MKGDIPIHIYWKKKIIFFHRQGIALNKNLQNLYNSSIGLPLEEETRFLRYGKLIFEYRVEEVFVFNLYFEQGYL